MGKIEQFEYIGFGKRVLMTLIDVIVSSVVLYPIAGQIMKLSFKYKTIIPELFYSLFFTMFWIFLVVKFGGTPGKLLLHARIVNKQGSFISVAAAILRRSLKFPLMINGYLKVKSAFTTMPPSETPQTLTEIGRAIHSYGGVYVTIGIFLGLIVFIDVGVILFNKKKRAIHDFMAGSFVISKKSYLEVSKSCKTKCT
jgi:uncharacterized RDD family membrane protein YckC